MPAPLLPRSPVPAAEATRSRRRLRRWMTGLSLAVPLLLAGALYLLLGPKPPPPPAVVPVTPQQAALSEQNVDAVRQALAEAPRPAPSHPASGEKSPSGAPALRVKAAKPQAAPASPVRHTRGPGGEDVVTLQLSQQDLNNYLSGSKKLRTALEAKGVHAVSVELAAPAGLVLHANATLKGFTDNALVAATLAPDPQTAVRLDITDARFGRLPPLAVRTAADRIFAQLLSGPHKRLPLTVQKVEVKDGNLVITGIQNAPAPAKG